MTESDFALLATDHAFNVLTMSAWADFVEENGLGYEQELRFLIEKRHRPWRFGEGWVWMRADDKQKPYDSVIAKEDFYRLVLGNSRRGNYYDFRMNYKNIKDAIIDGARALGFRREE